MNQINSQKDSNKLNQKNPIFNFDKFDFSKIKNKAIPQKKIENKNNDINIDKKIGDINDIFNSLGNKNNEANSDINLSNYSNNENDKTEIINIQEKQEMDLNYSLNDIFIINDEKNLNELNINQMGLNENNPYDLL